MKQTLKVAVTFSQNSSNNDSMLVTNQGLYQAITAIMLNLVRNLVWMMFQDIHKMLYLV